MCKNSVENMHADVGVSLLKPGITWLWQLMTSTLVIKISESVITTDNSPFQDYSH